MKMRQETGQRIRKIREALGMSQVQMAALMGLRRQAIGRIENGVHLPDPLSVLPLCTKYGVTLEYIYYNRPHLLPQWLIEKFPDYQV